eukprot:gene11123-7749_t
MTFNRCTRKNVVLNLMPLWNVQSSVHKCFEMTTRSSDVVLNVQRVVRSIPELIASGVKDENEREKYYLAQEAWIRERVSLLDETQSLIAQERDLLKIQHDHCREHIIKTRQAVEKYKNADSRFSNLCAAQPTLQKKEKMLDLQLYEVFSALEGIEQSLEAALKKKEISQNQHMELKKEERKRSDVILDLVEDVDKLKTKQQTLSADIKKLERQREALNEWSERLEAREVHLSSRKTELFQQQEDAETLYRAAGVPFSIPLHRLHRHNMYCDQSAKPIFSERVLPKEMFFIPIHLSGISQYLYRTYPNSCFLLPSCFTCLPFFSVTLSLAEERHFVFLLLALYHLIFNMAPKKKEIPTGPLGIIGSAAVAGLACVSISLMAAGLASDVYKWKDVELEGHQLTECYGLWGWKECGPHPIAHADWMIKTCGVLEASLKAACSMGICSLFGNFMVILFAVLYTIRKLTNKTPLIIFCLFTTLSHDTILPDTFVIITQIINNTYPVILSFFFSVLFLFVSSSVF